MTDMPVRVPTKSINIEIYFGLIWVKKCVTIKLSGKNNGPEKSSTKITESTLTDIWMNSQMLHVLMVLEDQEALEVRQL